MIIITRDTANIQLHVFPCVTNGARNNGIRTKHLIWGESVNNFTKPSYKLISGVESLVHTSSYYAGNYLKYIWPTLILLQS